MCLPDKTIFEKFSFSTNQTQTKSFLCHILSTLNSLSQRYFPFKWRAGGFKNNPRVQCWPTLPTLFWGGKFRESTYVKGMSKTLFKGSSLLGNSDAKIRCVNFPRLELENQLEDKKEVRCSLTCQPVLSFQFCGFFNFF